MNPDLISSKAKKLYSEKGQLTNIEELENKIQEAFPDEKIILYRETLKENQLQSKSFSKEVTSALLKELFAYHINLEDYEEIKKILKSLLEEDNEAVLKIVLKEIKNLILEDKKWIFKFINSLTSEDLSLIKLLNTKLEDIFILNDANLQLILKIYTSIQRRIEVLIIEEENNLDLKQSLALSIINQGYVHEMLSNLEQTEKLFLEGYKIRKALVNSLGTPETKSELDCLGKIYNYLLDFDKAKSFCLEAISIGLKLVNIGDTLEDKDNLAVSFNNLENLYEDLEELQDAKDSY